MKSIIPSLLSLVAVVHAVEFIEIDVSVADGWQEVSLQGSYIEPIVVTGAITNNDQDSVVAEVRNVDSDSFEVRLSDWGSPGPHTATETVTCMIAEEGEQSYGGLTILAGSVTPNTVAFNESGQSGYETINFNAIIKQAESSSLWNYSSFGQVVLSEDSTTPLHVRYNNSESLTEGIQYRFEKGDRLSESVDIFEMNYIVIQSGVTDDSVPLYIELSTSARIYEEILKPLVLNSAVSDPLLMLDAPIIRGGDNTAIRYQDLTTGGVNIRTDEAPGWNEIHTVEEVSYLLIGSNPNYVAPLEGDDFLHLTTGLSVGVNATTVDGNTLAVDGSSLLGGNVEVGGDLRISGYLLDASGTPITLFDPSLYYDKVHIDTNFASASQVFTEAQASALYMPLLPASISTPAVIVDDLTVQGSVTIPAGGDVSMGEYN